MIEIRGKQAAVRTANAVTTSAAVVACALVASVLPSVAAKDLGPADATCDSYAKASAAWRTCAAAVALEGTDAQLFYAGYWLAKNGHYSEALQTLARVASDDSATLTYRGFATRKLGRIDEALELYAAALRLDPANAVTRSYLGEAYLTLGRIEDARAELLRIDDICGSACGAYRELAAAFAEAGVPL